MPCCIHHDPDYAIVEIGCWLTAAAEGGGVAAAACRVLLGLARRDLAAERVEWHASTLNIRSRRLAERLGFTHEGTMRSNYVLRGDRLDTDVLSLVGAELDPFVSRNTRYAGQGRAGSTRPVTAPKPIRVAVGTRRPGA